MSSYKATVAAIMAAAVCIVGCSSPPEDDGPPQPKHVEFTGKVDSRLVGSWKAEGDRSALELAENGSAKILTVSASPQGDVKATIDGQWLCNGSDLLLQYTANGQPQSTVKYAFDLKGSKLTLVQGARLKTVYNRK